MRTTELLSVDLTTACNLKCADCCCNIPNRKSKHYPWRYFTNLAKYVAGKVHRIHVIGGEPMAHPKFGQFIPKFKELFGCKSLTLSTNGYKAREYPAALACFDQIYVTRFKNNGIDVDWLVANYGAQECDGLAHVSRSHRGGGNPCFRGRADAALYSDGRFFPCCVASGISGGVSIAPCDDWQRAILDVPMPCGECMFSE